MTMFVTAALARRVVAPSERNVPPQPGDREDALAAQRAI
jgi:hypothetical protein